MRSLRTISLLFLVKPRVIKFSFKLKLKWIVAEGRVVLDLKIEKNELLFL